MKLRDTRQREFATTWLKTKFGILYLCPRFGKIKTSINCFRDLGNPKVLIIYPIETIKKSWQDDLKKWEYDDSSVSYCTTASLWKLAEKPELYDLIVIDEIHLLSPANLEEVKKIIEFGNKKILGLSGTISDNTKIEIWKSLHLPIVAHYTIEQGIRERVITDYEINVVTVPLDDTVKYIQPSKKKQFFLTEKQRYDWLTKNIDAIRDANNLIKEKINAGAALAWPDTAKDLGLLPIQRMQVLKKSMAKLNITKRLISRFKDERILVFCGLTEIADSLGVPVYHSKNKNEEVKNQFCEGNGSCLATVDMFEAGVTIKPINKAIINSFDSNPENLSQRVSRLTGYEYDNPEKKAIVYIVCTDTVEKEWLSKALEFFDLTKVKYFKIQ